MMLRPLVTWRVISEGVWNQVEPSVVNMEEKGRQKYAYWEKMHLCDSLEVLNKSVIHSPACMTLLYWVESFKLRQKGGAGGEWGGELGEEGKIGRKAAKVTVKESQDKENEEEGDGKLD